MEELVRIDKWLWTARFYKTRSLAIQAVNGGKVHVNKQRVKPSYRIKVEDQLTISRPGYSQEIIVSALAKQRRSAKEAQLLYKETEESIAQRKLSTAQRKLLNQGLPRTAGKPSKHERKKIRQMLGKSK